MRENNPVFKSDKLNLIDVQSSGDITIAQVNYDTKVISDIISLHKAFELGYVIVKELPSERVNSIELENISTNYIFILDGDILKGAKQNRVVNTSVLVAPKSKIILPVSCVEEGRWRFNSDKFRPSDEVAHKSIRYSKLKTISELRVQNNASFSADQGSVWRNVSMCSAKLDIDSPTESHSDSFEYFKDEFNELTKKFSLNENANGLFVFVGGKLSSCEIFNSKQLLEDYFGKIIKSAAMDRKMKDKDEFYNKENPLETEVAIKNALREFETLSDKSTVSKALGVGEETRLSNQDKLYYSLVHENEIIHQTIITAD
jgi:hypothetical protein